MADSREVQTIGETIIRLGEKRAEKEKIAINIAVHSVTCEVRNVVMEYMEKHKIHKKKEEERKNEKNGD